MKKYIVLLMLFCTTIVFARDWDADRIQSSDRTKLWTMPVVTGTLDTTTGTTTLTNKTFVTPVLGAATGTSLGLGGALDASALLGVTSTTKGFLGPRVTVAQRDAISSPAAGLQVYNTETGKLNVYNGTSWGEVGSGSSGVNYISDADGATIGSWTTYADAAGTSPVDGTGGSPTFTYAVSTNSDLRGTSNFLVTHGTTDQQGEGFSYAFTIDPSDKGKVLQISLEYLVSSGTYADDDLQFWIYDVTNAALIQPAPYLLKNSGIIEKFAMEFQTSSSSTSYRLIGHVATATATAYTLRFDNWNLGPQAKLYGSPITDWVSYTTTVAGLGTGSSTNYAYWRRVGDTLQYDITITKDGSGGSGASHVTATIPSGLTIDAAKVPEEVNINFAHGVASYQDTAGRIAGVSVANTITQISAIIANSLTSNGVTGADFTASGRLTMKGSVPIVGWSSSVVMSDSASQSEVSAVVTLTSATHTSTGNWQNLPAATWTKVFEKGGNSFDTATGIYTVNVSGTYKVTGNVGFVSNGVGVRSLRIVAGGNTLSPTGGVAAYTGDDNYLSLNYSVPLLAGQTIQAQAYQTSGGNLAYGTGNRINIERISGPAQIAASSIVAFRGTRQGSAQTLTIASANKLAVTTVNDTHGGWVTDTYTTQIAGWYRVTLTGVIGNLTASTGYLQITLGSGSILSKGVLGNETSNQWAYTFSELAYYNAGVAITVIINPSGTSSTPTLLEGSSLTIERLGGI